MRGPRNIEQGFESNELGGPGLWVMGATINDGSLKTRDVAHGDCFDNKGNTVACRPKTGNKLENASEEGLREVNSIARGIGFRSHERTCVNVEEKVSTKRLVASQISICAIRVHRDVFQAVRVNVSCIVVST